MDMEALKQYLCNNTEFELGCEAEESLPMTGFAVTPQTYFNLTDWLLKRKFDIGVSAVTTPTPVTEDIKNNKTINHIRNIKLIQAMYSGKKFYVECYPTDKGALCFPNSNRAVKEIELPDFDLYEEKLGYKWVKQNQAPVTDKPFTEQNVGEIFGFDNGYLDEGVDLLNEKAIEWAANKDKGERMFTETEIGHLQSEVYKLTGKGEVMMLFNKLLGVSAS